LTTIRIVDSELILGTFSMHQGKCRLSFPVPTLAYHLSDVTSDLSQMQTCNKLLDLKAESYFIWNRNHFRLCNFETTYNLRVTV